jgi:hypothetical protein
MEPTSPERGPRSWTARVLAPIALVATVAAAALIVAGSLGDDGDEGPADAGTTVESEGCNPKADAALENGFYVIKPGENLNTVGERTCMEIEEVEELNPELDPQLLPVGACVNLRPDGCEAAATPVPSAAARTPLSL